MATLSNCTLSIEKVPSDDSVVKVTVKYTLTPSSIEKLLGTVFRSKMELWGEDGSTDQLRATITDNPFVVSNTTTSITRTQTRTVSKSTLNEDPGTDSEGAELVDEVFAKAVVSYAGNAPTPPPAITPATSAIHRGAWTV